ncbi:MAG TPA: glycosyltransferase family 4 protein [Acidobacteriota bacterium]|jgi:glycosyltransferase involved in cell wall biosynthesis
MKKKIAFVIQRYGKEVIGGSESLCRAVAEHLTPFYDVEVLTTCARDYYDWKNHYPEGPSVFNEVKILRFRVEGFRRHWRFHRMCKKVYNKPHTLEDERLWMRYQGPIAPGLYRHLEELRSSYAAVLFFTYLYPTTVDGITIAPERSILVPTAHDELQLYFSIFRPIFHSPRKILFNTEAERLLVHKTFGNSQVPSEVAGIGVELPLAAAAPARSANIPQMLEPEKFFLYLGRVDLNKGVRELTDWFLNGSSAFREQNEPNRCSLVFAGTPVLRLPKHPRLHLLGEVSESQKEWLLSNCIALVLPSLYESLSLSALETWAHGKAVIARSGSSVMERHVRDSGGGLLFHDAISLRQVLDMLAENPDSRVLMGERGRQYVAANYSWDRVTEIYRRSIEEVSQG